MKRAEFVENMCFIQNPLKIVVKWKIKIITFRLFYLFKKLTIPYFWNLEKRKKKKSIITDQICNITIFAFG